MGYTSKDILDDIHKAEPLPSKGKMTKIVKKENFVVCYLSQFLKILPFFFSFKVFGHATKHVGS